MRLFFNLSDFKPKPFLHNGFDEVTIISEANEDFKGSLILFNIKFTINIIGIVDNEDELFVFIDFDIDAVLSIIITL